MQHHASQGDIRSGTAALRRPISGSTDVSYQVLSCSLTKRHWTKATSYERAFQPPGVWQLGMASPRRYAPRARNEHTHHLPLESICSHSTARSQHAPRCFKPRRRSARMPQNTLSRSQAGHRSAPDKTRPPQTGTPKGLGNQRVAHAVVEGR